MYDQYYHFTAQPFQPEPDLKFCFDSATHRRAMSYLGYGLAQGEGVVLISGEAGAGKTMLVDRITSTADPRRLTVARVEGISGDAAEMLDQVLAEFGVPSGDHENDTPLERLETFLRQEARAGRRALLIVDEAHRLSDDALTMVAQLGTLQLSGQSLLQIFLFGQTSLQERIAAAPQLDALRQRIIATYHLDPMQVDEAAPYIEHRLRCGGWSGNPRFTPEAYGLLAQASGCVPLRLNGLVSRALLLGDVHRLDIIDERAVEAVIADLGADETGEQPVDGSAGAPNVRWATGSSANVPSESEAMAGVARLLALQAEVQALSAAINDQDEEVPPDAGPGLSAVDRIAELEQRLEQAEARLDEQDEVLRRILSKLIAWAERDAVNGPFSNRAA